MTSYEVLNLVWKLDIVHQKNLTGQNRFRNETFHHVPGAYSNQNIQNLKQNLTFALRFTLVESDEVEKFMDDLLKPFTRCESRNPISLFLRLKIKWYREIFDDIQFVKENV